MTRHKHAQTGLGIPSPLDRWINAMLRVLAMLLSNVASTIRMRLRRPAVNATRQMPQPLPGLKTDTQSKETNIAVPQDSPTSAHAEQRIADARPSKHERVLTTVSSTRSVSLAPQAMHLPQCCALMEGVRAIMRQHAPISGEITATPAPR